MEEQNSAVHGRPRYFAKPPIRVQGEVYIHENFVPYGDEAQHKRVNFQTVNYGGGKYIAAQAVTQALTLQDVPSDTIEKWIETINILSDPQTAYFKYRSRKRWLQHCMPRLVDSVGNIETN